MEGTIDLESLPCLTHLITNVIKAYQLLNASPFAHIQGALAFGFFSPIQYEEGPRSGIKDSFYETQGAVMDVS